MRMFKATIYYVDEESTIRDETDFSIVAEEVE